MNEYRNYQSKNGLARGIVQPRGNGKSTSSINLIITPGARSALSRNHIEHSKNSLEDFRKSSQLIRREGAVAKSVTSLRVKSNNYNEG
jgi:hypothetical protein